MRVQDNKKLLNREQKAKQEKIDLLVTYALGVVLLGTLIIFFGVSEQNRNSGKIKLVSMDFNINYPPFINRYRPPRGRTARWDLLIRVPGKLVGNHICLEGKIQATFLYKNVAIASSTKSYNKLEAGMPHVLRILARANEEDFSGVIEKEIMEARKEGKEVRFGTRLSFTDCREEAETSMMSFECDDETTLQFEPTRSDDLVKATAFGKPPTCKITH